MFMPFTKLQVPRDNGFKFLFDYRQVQAKSNTNPEDVFRKAVDSVDAEVADLRKAFEVRSHPRLSD
jgi:hypothetical protein